MYLPTNLAVGLEVTKAQNPLKRSRKICSEQGELLFLGELRAFPSDHAV
jgi:hypothetical protein